MNAVNKRCTEKMFKVNKNLEFSPLHGGITTSIISQSAIIIMIMIMIMIMTQGLATQRSQNET